MPVNADFSLVRRTDGLMTVGLAPATAIGGWSLELTVVKRMGGTSGLITKSMASGFYGVSGLNILNSGQGIFQATFNAADTSGLDPGNYAWGAERVDSGSRTLLTVGFLELLPTVR